MLTFSEISNQALVFLDKGGTVLYFILLASVLLWLLILERYWYLTFELPVLKKQAFQYWQPYSHQRNDYTQRLRDSLLNQLQQSASQHLNSISALTQALPLLGLLGTVIGMIQTFDVITLFGNGNARGLAGGISQALLTTMSGLVTALSGLYFSANLKHRVQSALDEVEAELD